MLAFFWRRPGNYLFTLHSLEFAIADIRKQKTYRPVSGPSNDTFWKLWLFYYVCDKVKTEHTCHSEKRATSAALMRQTNEFSIATYSPWMLIIGIIVDSKEWVGGGRLERGMIGWCYICPWLPSFCFYSNKWHSLYSLGQLDSLTHDENKYCMW